MSQDILVNVTPKEVRIALLENSVLQEVHIERGVYQGLIGNIYKGKVNRLLPGIQAAFIDIGFDRSAFLHISDLGLVPDDTHNNMDIRQYLRVGQDILVQVYKDPLGSKGARLTTQFTIPSRFLVLTPDVFQIAISQKISDIDERERLLSLIQPDEHGGYIFRTSSDGVGLKEIAADQILLQTLWQSLKEKAKTLKSPSQLFAEIPIILRILRDFVSADIHKILVDDAQTFSDMQRYTTAYLPHLTQYLSLHNEPTPIFDLYSVETEIERALETKLFLKSGGHIVFDQTEAMTTIDVNTGSYVGIDNLEKTVFKTNLEAIDVIARQIRLRNLGGIIIIDFIDMLDPLHQQHILEMLKAAVAKDYARSQISEISALGLVQMTRKRTRESLEHILCKPCPLCHKRGFIKSIRTICYEIFRELQRAAQYFPGTGFLVVVSPVVHEVLTTKEADTLANLEAALQRKIKLRSELTCAQDRFDVFPLSDKG